MDFFVNQISKPQGFLSDNEQKRNQKP